MKRFFKRLMDYFTGSQQNDNEASQVSNSITPLLRKTLRYTLLLTVMLFILLWFFFGTNKLFAVFTVSMVMGAYYVSGCVIGFIFAIPKSFQNNQSPITVDKDGKPALTSNPAYKDNTSIEEISDWITKIIVGLSLTQFNRIQEMVAEAAKNIHLTLQQAYCLKGNCDVNFFVFSYTLIIVYTIAGLACGYLWTRIEFPKVLKRKDQEIQNMKYKESLDGLLESVNNPQDSRATISDIGSSFANITNEHTILMRQIIAATPAGPDSDDPQRDRWGGKSSLDNMKVTAKVITANIPSLYKITILVCTVDLTPILSPVGILLHPTFKPQLRVLDPKGSNEVSIELIAYEAFAIGVLCNVKDSKDFTKLELDLNSLPGLPEGFYWS